MKVMDNEGGTFEADDFPHPLRLHLRLFCISDRFDDIPAEHLEYAVAEELNRLIRAKAAPRMENA